MDLHDVRGDKPIYIQIADWLENAIDDGTLNADEKVYSQYQLAKLFTSNPATAGKGLTISVDGNMAKGYDLSQYVEWDLPVWGEHEVVMPAQSKQKLVFSTYQDSTIMSQFSTNRSGGYYGGTSMPYRIVHLIIPETKDLDIQLDSEDYVEVLTIDEEVDPPGFQRGDHYH